MAPESLYETVLARLAEPGEPGRSRPPRPSAAVVPWRRRADGALEVFWVKRSEELSFMGGWHAFPGGALDRQDLGIEVRGEPAGVDLAPADGGFPERLSADVGDPGPNLPPGLAVCALRELFEETGILLAAGTDETADEEASGERLAEGRRRLLDGDTTFADLLADIDQTLDASRLTYAGRWLTPQLGPLRFDNRFFLLEWPPQSRIQPQVVPGEVVEGEWVAPGEGYRRWRRGEVLAAPPILHILRVLDEAGPTAGLPRLWNPVEANLGPFRRVEFRPGVLLFPQPTPTLPPATHTNCYVLGAGEAILVDPGSPYEREIEALVEAVEVVRAKLGRRVIAIWLTHHHADHTGGVGALRRRLQVPVLAHPLTAERLDAAGLEIDGSLEDGQRVRLAGDPPFSLRVLHTPGHARGHLCFFDQDRRSLIAGDMVAGLGTIVIDPPEGNMDDYLASLERLRELGPETLFPAHGPVIKEAGAKLGEYIRHRLWREARVLEAWRSGLEEPEAMLPVVYDDVPEAAYPLAVRQIHAHLDRLRRAGRLA